MPFDDFLRKAGDFVKDAINRDDDNEEQQQSHSQEDRPQEQYHASGGGNGGNTNNRFQSSFPQSSGDIKWYVDGASYFHAVSMALERESYIRSRTCPGHFHFTRSFG